MSNGSVVLCKCNSTIYENYTSHVSVVTLQILREAQEPTLQLCPNTYTDTFMVTVSQLCFCKAMRKSYYNV